MKVRWRVLAASLLALLVLSACGKASGDAKVASLGDSGGGGASPSPSASPKDREQATLDFAKCMRENGVQLDDPQPGQGIRIGLGGGGKPPTEAERQRFEAANEACRHHLDGAIGGPGNNGQGPPPEFQEKMLAVAKCMRANGFQVPDPEFDGGTVRNRLPGGIDPSDPAFQRVSEKCREEAGLDGMGPGGGPVDTKTEGGTR